MVQLGDKVRDRVTGATGIATGIAEYLYGCRRISVQPVRLDKGKPVEGQWFDEPSLIVLVPAKKPNVLSGGGPRNNEPRTR
jgi:hypothetical protein